MKDVSNKNYWQRIAKIYAPTFLWAERGAHGLRKKIMSLGGFKTYKEWDRDSFQEFISGYGFEIAQMKLVNGGLAPVGMLVAFYRTLSP